MLGDRRRSWTKLDEAVGVEVLVERTAERSGRVVESDVRACATFRARHTRTVPAVCIAVACALLAVACDSNSGRYSDPCDGFVESYVGSGLFARVPPDVELEIGGTDDPRPQAEAGAMFMVNGEEVWFWRALQYGPDDIDTAIGREVEGAAVFVRAEDGELAECVLGGLRYDADLDAEEARSEQE